MQCSTSPVTDLTPLQSQKSWAARSLTVSRQSHVLRLQEGVLTSNQHGAQHNDTISSTSNLHHAETPAATMQADPRWPAAVYDLNGREASDAEPILKALPDVSQYIFCSSAGVYLKSDQMPHMESDATDPKSRHKVCSPVSV